MGVSSGDDSWALGRCRTIGSAEYWGDLDARHREHRHHVRNLLIACVPLAIAGIVVHPSLFVLALMLLPLLAMEWYMLRRTSDQSRVVSDTTCD